MCMFIRINIQIIRSKIEIIPKIDINIKTIERAKHIHLLNSQRADHMISQKSLRACEATPRNDSI